MDAHPYLDSAFIPVGLPAPSLPKLNMVREITHPRLILVCPTVRGRCLGGLPQHPDAATAHDNFTNGASDQTRFSAPTSTRMPK